MRKLPKTPGRYVLRGQVLEDGEERINLFDGRFDTGFKVTEFHIWGSNFSSSTAGDCMGKLATETGTSTGPTTFCDAEDNREIAWAGSGAAQDQLNFLASIVDPDNIVVDNLYVITLSYTASYPVNYMVVMEKYDIGLSVGVATKARSLAGDMNPDA